MYRGSGLAEQSGENVLCALLSKSSGTGRVTCPNRTGDVLFFAAWTTSLGPRAVSTRAPVTGWGCQTFVVRPVSFTHSTLALLGLAPQEVDVRPAREVRQHGAVEVPCPTCLLLILIILIILIGPTCSRRRPRGYDIHYKASVTGRIGGGIRAHAQLPEIGTQTWPRCMPIA
jgi:hypothetical protein